MHMNNNLPTLMFDLDDTLIKNSIYFREVKLNVAKNLQEINGCIDVQRCITKFDQVEVGNIKSGKKPGHENFRVSLMQACYELFSYDFFHHKLYLIIDYQIQKLANHPVELIEGVEDTVRDLKHRGHRLFVFSKGNPKEQEQKLVSTGIMDLFENIIFVPKKVPEAYTDFINNNQIDKDQVYMIGNSPKSDINPAKSAGLKTIYIKSNDTWNVENESILEKEPVTINISSFSELKTLVF